MGGIAQIPDPKEDSFCWQILNYQEVDGDSTSSTIRLLPTRDQRLRPWILLVQQSEDRSLSYLVLEPLTQFVTSCMEANSTQTRSQRVYPKGDRVVELKYRVTETLQTAAAVALWAKELWKDDVGEDVGELLRDLSCPHGRRQLRSLFGTGAHSLYIRRIQRTKDYPMDEWVSSGGAVSVKEKVS